MLSLTAKGEVIMKTFNSKILGTLPAVAVLVFGLMTSGCEYATQEAVGQLPPGTQKNISEGSSDSETYRSLRAQIEELQSQVANPAPSMSEEELNALKAQIARLQGLIEALGNTPDPTGEESGNVGIAVDEDESGGSADGTLPSVRRRVSINGLNPQPNPTLALPAATEANTANPGADLATRELTLSKNDYVIDPVGGDGGSEGTVHCRPDYVMVGVSINAGAGVNKIGSIYCKQLISLSFPAHGPMKMNANFGSNAASLHDDITGVDFALNGFTVIISDNIAGDKWTVAELQMKRVAVDPSTGVAAPTTAKNTDVKFGDGDHTVSEFPVSCPKDHLLVGLKVRHGAVIDALGAICRQVYVGNENSVQNNNGRSVLGKGFEFGPLGLTGGGLGGNYFSKQCNDNQVMVGLAVNKGKFIDKLVEIRCKDPLFLSVNMSEPIEVGAGGEGGRYNHFYIPTLTSKALAGWSLIVSRPTNDRENFVAGITPLYRAANGSISGQTIDGSLVAATTCPDGYLLTGVKGRAGKYLDALGGYCREVVVGAHVGR